MSNLKYGFEKRLEGVSFDEAVTKVTESLKTEGFGVLTQIDVKGTLKKKLDLDFRRYVILGACNPQLAHRALELESQLGLLLPCNVVVQEDAGGVLVSIADPKAMFQVVENARVAPIAEEAERRLKRVMESLT